ncbi:thioredoxin [Puteibacter caeruleilacunae]|nr:thioredoxin [Puteibacter caeruleilacunae]
MYSNFLNIQKSENFKQMKHLATAIQLQEVIENEEMVLFYLSGSKCGVCHVLRPKVEELIETNFPKISMYHVDEISEPTVAAALNVFTVPTVVLYIQGKEYLRKSGSFGVSELYEEIKRPYDLLFE